MHSVRPLVCQSPVHTMADHLTALCARSAGCPPMQCHVWPQEASVMFLCASILCWEVHSGAYPPHLLPTCSPSPGSFRRFWLCILPCHPHPRPLDAIAPFPPHPQCTRQVGYSNWTNLIRRHICGLFLSLGSSCLARVTLENKQQFPSTLQEQCVLAVSCCVSCSSSEIIFKPVVPLITS